MSARRWLPIVTLFLAACSGTGGEVTPSGPGLLPSQQASPSHTPSAANPNDSPSPSATGNDLSTQTPTLGPIQSSGPSPTATPGPAGPVFDQLWATAPLTDVTTGEQFSLAGMAAQGKVVFVETMAIWCSNCRAQQREAVAAFAGIDPSQFVWVGLDVESSETADALARYREQNGFPFRYAIANQAVSRALADEFGVVVLSPPSVNLLILGGDGRVTHLTGHHSAAELATLAAEHGV